GRGGAAGGPPRAAAPPRRRTGPNHLRVGGVAAYRSPFTRGLIMTTFQPTASSKRMHPTVRAAIVADRSRIGPRDNVGEMERWISGLAGTALVAEGLKKGSISGLALAAIGGGLLYRGVTGHCGIYDRLGINTADKRRVGFK